MFPLASHTGCHSCSASPGQRDVAPYLPTIWKYPSYPFPQIRALAQILPEGMCCSWVDEERCVGLRDGPEQIEKRLINVSGSDGSLLGLPSLFRVLNASRHRFTHVPVFTWKKGT